MTTLRRSALPLSADFWTPPEWLVQLLRERLARPASLGSWVEITRRLFLAVGRAGASALPHDLVQALGRRRSHAEDPLTTLADYVSMRNDFAHSRLSAGDVKRALDDWLPRVDAILDSVPLAAARPIVVTAMDVDSEDGAVRYRYEVSEMVGEHPVTPTRTLTLALPLSKHRTYVLAGHDRALCVEPFLVVRSIAEGMPQLAFLDHLGEGGGYVDALTFQPTELDAELAKRQAQALAKLGLLD